MTATLPGFSPSTAIRCLPPDGGDPYFMLFGYATWADRQAGRRAREQDVRRARTLKGQLLAEIRLADWDAKDKFLQPLMEPDPDMTVEDAVREIGREAS